ncbi:MAG: alpha/beta hydrolase [Gemmatimonadaceae bacterium]
MPTPSLRSLDMTVPAADGVLLKGTLTYPKAGAGKRSPLAVLAHQYPATRDSYAPLVADLLALGWATLAFDLRGHGESVRVATPAGVAWRVIDTPRGLTGQDFADGFIGSIAKVGFAHISDDIVRVTGWGVSQNFIDGSRILLCGASVGGTGVLLAAPRLSAGLAGVVTFGAAGALAHGETAPAQIRQNCLAALAPHLLTSALGDAFDGAASVRAWSEGAANVTPLVVPGDGHAMAIYYQVRTAVLAFARRCLKPSATPKRAGKTRRRK